MKIKLVSDLHLEFSDFVVPKDDCDVLILAGDILLADYVKRSDDSDYGQRFRAFIDRCANDFPHVIYIAGNHEFYGGNFVGSLNDLRDVCGQYNNFYFLEDDVALINDVAFVGSTLWTDLNKRDPLTVHAVGGMMNDYHRIRNDGAGYRKLQASDTLNRHDRSLKYIKTVVANANDDAKIVVVTHHSPSFQSCHEMYKDDSIMNGAFHNELSDYVVDQPKIKLWVHGHTHNYCDYMIGDTRVVCNPRGYESYRGKENTGWNPNLVLEV